MLWIPIDRELDIPLIRQVYEQIRTCILRGELHVGEKLPSTRELSTELKVSRNVILEAYELLLSEGYIETRQGAGTYVAEGTYLEQNTGTELFKLEISESRWSEKKEKSHDVISFRSGIPALDLFPRQTWAKLSHQVCHETSSSIFGYDNPEGRPELRHVLSHYLLKTRGVQCHPNQLVITAGATQALTLVAKLLLTAGDEVIIEDPVTHDIQKIFQAPGSVLHPIPVDEHGMMTDLISIDEKPKFVFVTPSHQFPLGGALPIQRRIQLIQFAREAGCYIVEDDYDSEFRYEGAPVSSLQGLDTERVIYIGTFSKILSPALRLAYLILPPNLIEQCRRLKWFSDLHTPSLDQLVLARFMEKGYLERHIAKMKKIYRKRRDHLIHCLTTYFDDKIRILGHTTGMHLVVECKDVTFSEQLLERIYCDGVLVHSVEEHTIRKERHQNQLILGYGNLTAEEIEEGILRLRRALS